MHTFTKVAGVGVLTIALTACPIPPPKPGLPWCDETFGAYVEPGTGIVVTDEPDARPWPHWRCRPLPSSHRVDVLIAMVPGDGLGLWNAVVRCNTLNGTSDTSSGWLNRCKGVPVPNPTEPA
jgi:hypothetical protein